MCLLSQGRKLDQELLRTVLMRLSFRSNREERCLHEARAYVRPRCNKTEWIMRMQGSWSHSQQIRPILQLRTQSFIEPGRLQVPVLDQGRLVDQGKQRRILMSVSVRTD